MRGDVHLPSNSRAAVQMTSLLGEKFVALLAPAGTPSTTDLQNGSHIPLSSGAACAKPLLRFADRRAEGAIDASGRIAGCYVHGLFSDDRQRGHWLRRVASQPSALAYEADVEATLDRLADHIERHIDCNRLLELARVPNLKATG